jgi:hypothetical protein
VRALQAWLVAEAHAAVPETLVPARKATPAARRAPRRASRA